jgi:3',5'-cyclic AMP phosphodiesterase CpdA
LTPATVRQQADAVASAHRQLDIDLDSRPPTPIASFLHFSDVQLREPGAKLGGQSLSHQLDKLVPSFERNYDQELYSMFVYGALVRTANEELKLAERDPDRPPPQFMIHTGDAVDAGLSSEFEMFRNYSDMLRIPWYQVIGNHDVLAFGNMQLEEDSAKTEDERCQGPRWELPSKKDSCTCTQLDLLIREQILQNAIPDNLGTIAHYSTISSLLPLLLRRICIRHRIDGDSFVMDPTAGRSQPEPRRRDREPTRSGRPPRTANSINTFIAAHCRPPGCQPHMLPDDAPDRYAPLIPEYAVPPGVPPPCAEADGDGPRSVMHGFDLLRVADIDPESGESRDFDFKSQQRGASKDGSPIGGYYCFEIRNLAPITGRRIWAVVLNTVSEVGAYGAFSRVQQAWLAATLGGPQIQPHDLVLIFAHHPIWDIFDPKERTALRDQLSRHPNVVGYFAGHVHQPMLRVVHPEGHEHEAGYHHFWEILAPAVISYPQQSRQVTVKLLGDIGYFEILSITPRGTGESAPAVERALTGAALDYCHDHPEDCVDGRPRLASRAVSFPRLFFRLSP